MCDGEGEDRGVMVRGEGRIYVMVRREGEDGRGVTVREKGEHGKDEMVRGRRGKGR